MKTITIDNVNLETKEAKCSFCGESEKLCVRGSVPFMKEKTELKWLREGALGHERLYRIQRDSVFPDKEIGDWADICLDCIIAMSPMAARLKEAQAEERKGCGCHHENSEKAS